MGCDGGTIPKRDELVRTKKKKEQKDKNAELNFRWRCCSISQAPLQQPVVACGLGRLYSKDSVINGLLDRSLLPDSAKHLKSLRDVVELKLTSNPGFSIHQDKGDSYVDHQSSPYICPLIGLEMNGKFKFIFAWTCGCVVSERAFKEIKSDICQQCQKPVYENDLVVLNATGEDLDIMKVRLESRQARIKAEKKAKKLEKVLVKQECSEGGEGKDDKDLCGSFVKADESKETKKLVQQSSSSKLISNGVKRSAGCSSESLGMQSSDLKKAKSDYSVAKDGHASQVYKSLFTSCNKAKKQDRAHWVTYNPFYN